MHKPKTLTILALAAIACSQVLGGCSSDKPAKLASQADVLQASVAKAKTMLDQLEKLPKSQRQVSANKPRMAATLKVAASDPETKKRIDDLGITLGQP